MNELVRHVLARFQVAEGVCLVQTLKESLPLVPLDEREAKRAVANVVKNALEAVSEKGDGRTRPWLRGFGLRRGMEQTPRASLGDPAHDVFRGDKGIRRLDVFFFARSPWRWWGRLNTRGPWGGPFFGI
jgi:hypothetical protein